MTKPLQNQQTAEWQTVKLGDLCDITRGASPRPIHEWISTSGIPWVKISDATASNSRFISKTNEFILKEGREKSVVVHPGDLILSNSATPGMPKFMNIEACIHDGWLLLRNFKGLDQLFCYYLLLNERPYLVQKGNGSVFTNLKTDIVKSHNILLPPLAEQRSIASILGSLDDKIELNRQMNETLEQTAQALFKSWFVDFDPVRAKAEGRDTGLPKEIADLFPESFEDSELGEIPKGWRVSTVGEEFNLIMGQSPPGETYNEAGEGLPFFQGRTDFGFRFPLPRVYCSEPTRLADEGDTLVSVRAPVGSVNMATAKSCIGRGVAAIRHKSNSRSFTYYFMRYLEPVFAQFEAGGTVFGSINKADFNGLSCITPSERIIEAFEKCIFPVDEQIEVNERQTGALASIRDALLPKLLSGEVLIT